MKKFRIGRVDSAKILMSAVFITFVLFPFLRMVFNIEAEDFTKVVTSPDFGPAVRNTLLVALTTTAISLTIALLLSFCLQRTNVRFRSVLSVLLVMPMLIPSISHGMALTVLFGTNGIFTQWFGWGTIYGFWGMVTASVLYSYPAAFLMLNDVLKYEDASPYEAAVVLGIPKLRRISAITLPYLSKPLISAAFAVFTLTATDYGIPLTIGGNGKVTTLAVVMYREVIGQSEFGKGSVIGLFLLIPAAITFVYNTLFKERGKQSFVTRPFEVKKNGWRDAAAYAFCVVMLAAIGLLLASFCMRAFVKQYPIDMTFTLDNLTRMFRLRGDTYLINSVIISICVSAVGVATAFLTAYLTTRLPSRTSRMLHLFSIASLAIPGLVLGLSYSMAFSRTFIYGTMVILVLANLMHFFASPYLMMYNSLSKMNENLEDVGKTMGISRLHMIAAVIIPQCRSTLLEMCSYFFVNSMMTISAVSFLANESTRPISLMIERFQDQSRVSEAAVVALLILAVNVVIKGVVYLINKRLARQATA